MKRNKIRIKVEYKQRISIIIISKRASYLIGNKCLLKKPKEQKGKSLKEIVINIPTVVYVFPLRNKEKLMNSTKVINYQLNEDIKVKKYWH